MIGADRAAAQRAAYLAKADLVTDMVGEFPELQGLMGRYYARARRRGGRRRGARSSSTTGRASPATRCRRARSRRRVALADKLETLAGMFGIGAQPTGDKDPFGLRRHAIGVIRILIEGRLRVAAVRPRGRRVRRVRRRSGGAARRRGARDFHLRAAARLPARAGLHARTRSKPCCASARTASTSSRRGWKPCARSRRCPKPDALAAANKRIVNILRKAESDVAAAVDRGPARRRRRARPLRAFQRPRAGRRATTARAATTPAR